jgi:acetyltransferase
MHTRLFGLFGLTNAFTRSARALPGGVSKAAPSRRTVTWTTACGTELTLRPVRPEDAALLGELFEDGLSRAARYSRFHGAVGRLSASRLAWMADADFQRHAAFIVTRWEDGLEHAVAEGRWVRTAVTPGAEFALAVADAWQGRGIGRQLLAALVQAGREQGLPCLLGDVLPGNQAMQSLARSQRFGCATHPEDAALMRAELSLAPQRPTAFASFTTAATAWLH